MAGIFGILDLQLRNDTKMVPQLKSIFSLIVTSIVYDHPGPFLPARKHPYESGLPGPVLAEHDQDLRVGERAGLNRQVKVAELLGHVRVRVVTHALDDLLLGRLSDLEHQRVLAETQVLSRHEPVQKHVNSCPQQEQGLKIAHSYMVS